MTEETVLIGLLAGLLLTNQVMAGLGQCSSDMMVDIMERGEGILCAPQPTLVPLTLGHHVGDGVAHQVLAPSHLEVDRCAGTCPHPALTCLPATTRSKEVEVILTQITLNPGPTSTLCTSLSVEEHTSCDCACRVGPSDCGPNHRFIHYECQCVCRNEDDRGWCLSRGWIWDPATCSCQCPGRPYPTCPSSYVFDYVETCACIPVQYHAFSKLELVVVVVVLGLFSVIISLAQCYKRRVGLFRHRQNIHRLRQEEDLSVNENTFRRAIGSFSTKFEAVRLKGITRDELEEEHKRDESEEKQEDTETLLVARTSIGNAAF